MCIRIDAVPEDRATGWRHGPRGAELLARLFERPDGVVRLVEELPGDRQRCHGAEAVEQVVAVAVLRMRLRQATLGDSLPVSSDSYRRILSSRTLSL